MSVPNGFRVAPPRIHLTPGELALRWRLSTRTLDRWRKDRFGPAWLALGGRILYLLTDVEAFEARSRQSGP